MPRNSGRLLCNFFEQFVNFLEKQKTAVSTGPLPRRSCLFLLLMFCTLPTAKPLESTFIPHVFGLLDYKRPHDVASKYGQHYLSLLIFAPCEFFLEELSVED